MPRRVPSAKPQLSGNPGQLRRDYRNSPGRKPLEDFYNSRPWRKLRTAFLFENPLCAKCRDEGRTTLAEQVHHIQELKDHPELAMDWGNLQGLCRSCHNGMRRKP